MTDDELDALVFQLNYNHPDDIDYLACSAAITTLRAQLAHALAEVDALTHTVVCLSEWLTETNARADRAEAALAAQIAMIPKESGHVAGD